MLAWAKNGVFPVEGGTLAQTRSFMEMLELFVGETNDLEKAEVNRRRSSR